MSKSKKPVDPKYNDPGYPPYPSNEDIYNREEEEKNVDPEHPDETKSPPARTDLPNREMGEDEDVMNDKDVDEEVDNADQMVGIDPENPYQKKNIPRSANLPNEETDENEDLMGEDLDVPGSELDDANEDIGEEDEENNYYSLGGDKNPEDNREQ